MACDLSDRVWSLEEIVIMANSYAPAQARPLQEASMRKTLLGWSMTGAVVGAMGFAYNLITLGAIINGVAVSRGWVTLGAVLCPWFIPLRNVWGILALNCILYALLFRGVRFAWVRLFR